MRLRPGAHLTQAGEKGLACTALVDVLDVHDLETGLQHQAAGIFGRIGGKSGGCHHGRALGVSVAATLRVGVDVDLNLPDAVIQLLRQRRMAVVQACGGLRILLLQPLGSVRPQTGVVAVVRADDLDLVELNPGLGACS